MKLLMLCREPRLYSCQRLKEAAESCGHQMDILDPNRCILKLDKNQPHFSLYYQQNAESEPYLLPDLRCGVTPLWDGKYANGLCGIASFPRKRYLLP